MPELKGIITPTITPMKADLVDYDAIDALLDFLEKAGVSGIFPMGSTAAFPIVSVELQIKVLEYFMDKKKPNMFFLAGVGRNSFEETLAMAQYAKELGVDAISIVTPYYLRMNQDSIYAYYEKLLSQVDFPTLVYNIPQNTGNNIDPKTILKLKEKFSHLIGIKDSSGNFANFSAMIDTVGKDFNVIQGQDDILLPSLAMGAVGGINGTSNFSDLSVRVYREFADSNFEKARRLQAVLTTLKKLVNSYDFPQAVTAAFIEIVSHQETQSPFPLKDLEPDVRRDLGEKITQILNTAET